MASELPWNVAGIPPQAREAARAAARREGLSVGEWMTRRILRSLADGEMPREWWGNDLPVERPVEHRTERQVERRASEESQEMLARVSRSGTESQNAWRRIDDQLSGLARRLEQNELVQSESTRAASRAEAELEMQSRQHELALDRIDTRAAHLNERLMRMEERTRSDSTRDAVNALHQGLSNLADQIAETAQSGAARTAEIAGTLDTIAARLASYRKEEQENAQALAQRVSLAESALEQMDAPRFASAVENLSEQLLHHHDEQREICRALAERIAHAERALEALDAGRSASVEQTSAVHLKLGTVAERIARAEAALQSLDAGRAASAEEMTSLHQEAGAVAKLSSAVDSISHEISAGETARAADWARLEERLSGIEEQLDNRAADQRFGSLETALANLTTRLERSEREKTGVTSTMEDELRNLALRLDAAEKQSREAIAELGVEVKETSARIEHSLAIPPPAVVETLEPPAAEPAPIVASVAESSTAPSEPVRIDVESFMAKARQRAREATGAPAESALRWPLFSGAKVDERNNLRLYLLAGLAVVAVTASAAGLLLKEGAFAPRAKPVVELSHQTNTPVAQNGTIVSPPRDRLVVLADGGNPQAQELLGLRYVDGDGLRVNEAEGAKWLERAAQHGQAVAAYRLGTLYEHGHGVPADTSRAAMWYMVAAKAGNRKAMHNLAVAYAQGVGVPKNPVEAAQWFSRAADLGLADSQFNLGVLYERGLGVPQNLVDAYKWYAIAAQEGDVESKARIDALASQLGAEDRAVAEKAAREFRVETENRGANAPPDATTLLGG